MPWMGDLVDQPRPKGLRRNGFGPSLTQVTRFDLGTGDSSKSKLLTIIIISVVLAIGLFLFTRPPPATEGAQKGDAPEANVLLGEVVQKIAQPTDQ